MSLKTKDNNEDRIIILNNYLASLINTRLAEMGIVHNGAGFTFDAGFDLITVNRAVTLL